MPARLHMTAHPGAAALMVFFLGAVPARAAAEERSGDPAPRDEARVVRLVPAPGDSCIVLPRPWIIPGTLVVERGGERLLEGVDYDAHYPEGRLCLRFGPEGAETLSVRYRDYGIEAPARFRAPLPFRKPASGGDVAAEGAETGGEGSAATPATRRASVASLFDISGAKGFRVGRGRGGEFTLDQSLDLAVDGTLPGGTRVELQMSDQSLPISAEGSSVELRELDQVSFRVFSGPASATLGDYRYALKGFEFARIERKLEGVRGEWRGDGFALSGAGAVRPGRFATSRLEGEEGRQGPYPLRPGEDVTAGFAILSGTERVYLDGVAMERGEDRDYTIDYNLGTITFTSRRLIGADSRIEVDYEYSEGGGRGSFYATSFRSEPGWAPVALRGYIVRQSDVADSAGALPAPGGSGRADLAGLAWEYRSPGGGVLEGEGAYQGSRRAGAPPIGGAGPSRSGAFRVRGGLEGVSLFDRRGGTDRWRVTWTEKRVGDAFEAAGRRYAPDFRWTWGLSPAERGGESWHLFDLGVDLRKGGGMALQWGRIDRANGEGAVRRRVGGRLGGSPEDPTLRGEVFTVRSDRRTGDGLEAARISGRSLRLSRKWGRWTPSVAYASREERVGDREIGGEAYDEVAPAVRGTWNDRLSGSFGLRLRRDRAPAPDGAWHDASRLLQGRAGVEFGGAGGTRVRGSSEFRRRWYFQGSDAQTTTLLGRGEFLAAGRDRGWSTSTTYELSSTSNVVQRAVFVPERDDEGEYLEDGTFVGPGNGTHVRRSVVESDGSGQVVGAKLTGVQTIDLTALAGGASSALVSLTHTSTFALQDDRIGADRGRVYLFLPGAAEDLFRSVDYRGRFEGAWGEEGNWTTGFDVAYTSRLDRRFSNLNQRFRQRETTATVGGAFENGADMKVDVRWRVRADDSSGGAPADFRERRVESEWGIAPGPGARLFVALVLGEGRDRITGARIREDAFGPGADLFFGGGGNLRLQYRLERLGNRSPRIAPPAVMLAGRDIGTTHRYQARANWRLRGAVDFTASFSGRKRPGGLPAENTGRTEFTYRF